MGRRYWTLFYWTSCIVLIYVYQIFLDLIKTHIFLYYSVLILCLTTLILKKNNFSIYYFYLILVVIFWSLSFFIVNYLYINLLISTFNNFLFFSLFEIFN